MWENERSYLTKYDEIDFFFMSKILYHEIEFSKVKYCINLVKKTS